MVLITSDKRAQNGFGHVGSAPSPLPLPARLDLLPPVTELPVLDRRCGQGHVWRAPRFRTCFSVLTTKGRQESGFTNRRIIKRPCWGSAWLRVPFARTEFSGRAVQMPVVDSSAAAAVWRLIVPAPKYCWTGLQVWISNGVCGKIRVFVGAAGKGRLHTRADGHRRCAI